MHSPSSSSHPDPRSPPFGYLSPPIDSPDYASDDGDDIQTPLTDHLHSHTHHPYSVYKQSHNPSSPSHFQAFSSPDPHAHDVFEPNRVKPQAGSSSLSILLHPSPPEGDVASRGLDSYFPYSSPTPNALDLANASLEFDPFAASFGASMAPPLPQSAPPDMQSFPSCSSPSVDTPLDLSPLPALTVDSLGDLTTSPFEQSLLFGSPEHAYIRKARVFSPRFPEDHLLNSVFARTYLLGDELGAGGYGFVMTARHMDHGHEVAVKFIIKNKVPEHCWWQDEYLGRVPTEVLVMSLLNNKYIVKCLDLFEDDLYFYLVQELHGTPWKSRIRAQKSKQLTAPSTLSVPSPSQLSTPSLTPSPSAESDISLLETPPQLHVQYTEGVGATPQDVAATSPGPSSSSFLPPSASPIKTEDTLLPPEPRPSFSRRPSYDLFECIEQSKHKRLSETQARFIFAQVVEAVHYLDCQGITHCDIKDENLVVDKDLNVKLIDFGSAVVADPAETRPYYTLFFGTTAYAASEILRKKPYLAAPAEIWTLGVLLSYLLTGNSPFPTEQDAVDARIVIKENLAGKLSRGAMGLMQRCLEKDPKKRADIAEVREHRWLKGALGRGFVIEE
ncbi:hypothetical protein EIP91_012366 [Steccherinum ochraceum]|uniref:Protein kinase domain-containing protein n=1 Tax=Steccherinum ochraceum TaxID=92696 RepID=A0A4R0RQ15_9APHY|nr:hypothetical protein EIP91_012366 [Steccherinum ochraceum]